MDLHRYPQAVDLLAAEYVLGTLRGSARRRFQFYAERDSVIRKAVDDWQRRISPMTELAPPRMPPASVWETIERRLNLAGLRDASRTSAPAPLARPQPAAPGLFGKLAFWRGWAIGVTAIAALAVVVAVRSLMVSTQAPAPTVAQQPEAAVSHVAVLNNADAHPVMLVAWDETHSSMTLHPLGKVDVPAGRAMELWGIPASGHPVALGMLPDSADGKLPAGAQKPGSYAALAVSIEAPGGSPNPNAPSGPVVFSGKLVPVT